MHQTNNEAEAEEQLRKSGFKNPSHSEEARLCCGETELG